MDGEDDHVYLLVEYPPKVSVSSLVNSLKASPAASCDSAVRKSANAIGEERSGPRATSPPPVAEHPSPSSAGTSSSRGPQIRRLRRHRAASSSRYPSPA